MFNPHKTILLLLSTFFLLGCSAADKNTPAANVAWSSTDKQDEKTQGKGALQQSLDKWMSEEWESSFEDDAEQAKKDEAAQEHFSLQHYVDKSKKYMDKKEEEEAGEPKKKAHHESLNSLPVIGR
ncbi:MAG: hypothetical protein IBX43_10960 [Campylobacterales bacterium]|nr:hypothetical protein [Campylobacterales bacterium]